MTRILVIDDDIQLLAHLGAYFKEEGFSVQNGKEARRAIAKALSGSVIVEIDVTMPRLNGLKGPRLTPEQSTLPVLMLTPRGDESDRTRGLELGAEDYMGEPCTPRELVARISAILRLTRRPVHDPVGTPLVSGSLAMWPGQRRAERLGEPLQLTSTEFSLLELLLRRAGRPVAKADLSQHALGRTHTRRDRSVDVHLSRIRRKLGTLAGGRPLIQSVRGQGYQLLKE